MLHQTTLARLLPTALDLAEQACVAIMELYNSYAVTVEQKVDDTPLTNADIVANRIIINGLAELMPTIPIVSEESLELVGDTDFKHAAYWLVDPIDGTKEFIKHNGEFTVNIGLIDNGQPVLGVVAAPALSKTYYAIRGGGAWLQTNQQPAQAIHVSPWPDQPRVVVSRSHLEATTKAWLKQRNLQVATQLGSSLKFTAIAEGNADVFPRLSRGPHEWDLAAAHAVLNEAGGNIWLFSTGQPVRYGQPLGSLEEFLAGSPTAVKLIN